MHLLLLGVSFLLLLIAIYMADGDAFSPTVIMLFGYFLCSIFSVMGEMSGMEDVSFGTALSFIGGWLAFIAGGLLVNAKRRKRNHANAIKLELRHLKLSIWMWGFIVLVNLIITILLYREVVRIAGSVSATTSYNSITYSYKQNVDDIPINSVVKQLLKVSKSCAYIFIFIFSNNVIQSKRRRKAIFHELYLLVPTVLYAIQCFIRGGRFTIITLIIALIVSMYILNQCSHGWMVKIKLKLVVKLMLAIIAVLFAFWLIKGAVGRKSELQLSDYLVSYLGGSYNLFEKYKESPPEKAHETFAAMAVSLNKTGITNINARGSHEFRRFFGRSMLGNAYSANRNYYNDFGIVGILVMNFLFSVFFNSIYKRFRLRPIYKQEFLFLFYLANVFSVAFMFFTDYFFAQLSIGYAVEFGIMYIIYYLLFKCKIRIGKVNLSVNKETVI